MIALVTGANSEIGVSICLNLLNHNYKVVACVHNDETRIRKINNDNLVIKKLDLTSEEEIVEILSGTKWDLIVNTAAYYFDDYYDNITKADFMKSFEVNVVAPFLLAKYADMKDGLIINISSTDGIDTYNELTINYSASKAALNNLTKTLAYSLKKARVYALALGWVSTENILSINQDYLNYEMKRTGQKRLIDLKEINEQIEKILNLEYENGSIVRIDGDIDVY